MRSASIAPAVVAGYHALDERLQNAMLAALLDARVLTPDGWPTPKILKRTARRMKVSVDRLAATFGLVRFKYQRREVWLDTVRETPGSGDFEQRLTDCVRDAFDWHRGFVSDARKRRVTH